MSEQTSAVSTPIVDMGNFTVRAASNCNDNNVPNWQVITPNLSFVSMLIELESVFTYPFIQLEQGDQVVPRHVWVDWLNKNRPFVFRPMTSIEPNSNPFNADLFHMGTHIELCVLGPKNEKLVKRNITVMFNSADPDYLILVDEITGQRMHIVLPQSDEVKAARTARSRAYDATAKQKSNS